MSPSTLRRRTGEQDVVEEKPPNPESIIDADERELAENKMVKVPRCMYDL